MRNVRRMNLATKADGARIYQHFQRNVLTPFQVCNLPVSMLIIPVSTRHCCSGDQYYRNYKGLKIIGVYI